MLINTELMSSNTGLLCVISLFKLNCEFTYSVIPDYIQFYVKMMLLTDIFHAASQMQVGRL